MLSARQLDLDEPTCSSLSVSNLLQSLLLQIIYSQFQIFWKSNNNTVAVTFIAFNTVNHEILFERLCHNGVRGIALDLMKSYQNLKINSVHSYEVGVSQDSVSESLLFLVYINDMFENGIHMLMILLF